ncbi:MAG: hypothetical protein QOE84_1071, partial [Actinomycetota bacterium]|nr:hypothetical protein [Actinomycetota bacterium]
MRGAPRCKAGLLLYCPSATYFLLGEGLYRLRVACGLWLEREDLNEVAGRLAAL